MKEIYEKAFSLIQQALEDAKQERDVLKQKHWASMQKTCLAQTAKQGRWFTIRQNCFYY